MNSHSLHFGGRSWIFSLGLLLVLARPERLRAETSSDCNGPATPACYFAFTPAGSTGRMHFYASRTPGDGAPTSALVALHGHPRDANTTFNAALEAVQRGGALHRSLVVAPVFQVDGPHAARCRTADVPPAQAGDLLWTCSSWIAGSVARNPGGLTSFAALDALVAELQRQWPSLQNVTIAGFSAGAQMVQHYIGFAAVPPDMPAPMVLRYVVAAPGTWLYFDPVWPAATVAACPQVLRWKYGTENLPTDMGRSAAEARAHYAQADIHYLEGARDSSDAPGTFYKVLDKSCAAMAQGPYRLQRGLAYAEYDRKVLAPDRQRSITTVPGCAHGVACVFTAPEARSALLGD